MAFIDKIIEKAQQNPKTIVLPEPEDERTLRAADMIVEKGIAKPVLVGAEDAIRAKLKELSITREIDIVDPEKSDKLDDFTSIFYELRKAKGMTEEKAAATMRLPIPYGIMMLHEGMGDGLVAGAIHSTADTLRPALQILKTAPGCSLVSSVFFMDCPDKVLVYGDCGLVEEPTAEQLAEIALSSAQTAMSFGIDPMVAMLCYSTKGSASSGSVEKVVEATKLAQGKIEERFGADSPVQIDGELQADAALVEAVGAKKAPDSAVAGKARVLIFPDLNAGNIAYKLTERLAGADAYGPVLQGMRLPVNDLSRGCSAEDIVGVAAVTVVQSQIAG
ncbi:MAG: phosphate acetyltransferase [bacterium]|nr:phosphate acetyltransferase [bacterium]